MASIHNDDPGSLDSAPSGAEERCATLARRNDELEVVVAAARLGFCRIDAATQAMTANSQFKVEFGWPPDAAPGWRDLVERIEPEERGKFLEAVRSALTNGAEIDLVVRAIWPERAGQWIALRGRASNSAGTPGVLILTSRNVTAENLITARERLDHAGRLQQERSLRSEAEASNRAKDQFLALFSHELRSPLNAVLGWNRILTLKRPGDSEVASITRRIEQSARTQLRMVNDLIDFGRIGTGELKIEERPMQLAAVASTAVELAQSAAAAKSITITTDFEPGAGQLRGDRERLQQVIGNLLSNAIKFTPSGGQVTLTLRTVEGFVELTVTDTGQGIPPQWLPHIFDRFRRFGESARTGSRYDNGGLGLGLALVREIVVLHGGSVTAVSSGPGAGATFVIRLPSERPKRLENSQRAGGAQTLSLSGLSILVVDDEPDARAVVAETLRLEGACVTVTDSAVAALQTVQSAGAHFDIIVTDIGMPEKDGYSLVRQLRTLQAGRQILAIAVTGYASKKDVEAAMDAGFDLHVPKPVDFDTFVPMVKRLASSTR